MENSILDKRIKPGMVFKGGSAGDNLSVIKRIDYEVNEEVTVGKLSEDGKKIIAVHWAGFNWYKTGCFDFVRQMSDREFNKLKNN